MKKIAIIAVVLMFLAQCSSTIKYHGNTSRDIKIKKLAMQINDFLRRPPLKNKEIGILSFANLNNLKQVEPLGRLIQERLAHELFKRGFRIVEIRMTEHIYFEPLTGELNLTRFKEELKRAKFPEIQSLIVGTYIDAGDYVYVNSRMVEMANDLVRSSGEIKIKKGAYLHKLIKLGDDPGGKKKEVFERFPIKNKTGNESN